MTARAFAACLFALTACTGAPSAHGEPSPLSWTIGDWRGHRIDAATGARAPMTATVRAILGGAGTFEELEIEGGSAPYRGATLQVYDAEHDRWVRQYVNDVRRSFVRLDGHVDPEGSTSTWQVVAPGRMRRSRLTSERIGERGWTRTMRISTDDGASWQELWRDELRRVPGSRAPR